MDEAGRSGGDWVLAGPIGREAAVGVGGREGSELFSSAQSPRLDFRLVAWQLL